MSAHNLISRIQIGVVLAKVAGMSEHDIATGERFHAIIKASARPLAKTLDWLPANRGTVSEHQRQMR